MAAHIGPWVWAVEQRLERWASRRARLAGSDEGRGVGQCGCWALDDSREFDAEHDVAVAAGVLGRDGSTRAAPAGILRIERS